MSSDLIIPKPPGSGLAAKGSFQVATTGVPPNRSSGLPSKSQMRVNSRGIEIAFLFDATGSRSATWRAAQDIQAEMISEYASAASNVEVGIIVHRGEKVETLGWFKDGDKARNAMQEVSCQGGLTRIETGLRACLGTNNDKRPKAIVMVGDHCEEDSEDIASVARSLKGLNIPVHAFHEGGDSEGERIYKMVADITNGAFAKFGPDMPLKNLVRPLFIHTIHGSEAFQKLAASGDEGARALIAGGFLALPPPTR